MSARRIALVAVLLLSLLAALHVRSGAPASAPVPGGEGGFAAGWLDASLSGESLAYDWTPGTRLSWDLSLDARSFAAAEPGNEHGMTLESTLVLTVLAAAGDSHWLQVGLA